MELKDLNNPLNLFKKSGNTAVMDPPPAPQPPPMAGGVGEPPIDGTAVGAPQNGPSEKPGDKQPRVDKEAVKSAYTLEKSQIPESTKN